MWMVKKSDFIFWNGACCSVSALRIYALISTEKETELFFFWKMLRIAWLWLHFSIISSSITLVMLVVVLCYTYASQPSWCNLIYHGTWPRQKLFKPMGAWIDHIQMIMNGPGVKTRPLTRWTHKSFCHTHKWKHLHWMSKTSPFFPWQYCWVRSNQQRSQDDCEYLQCHMRF